jgi:S-DNA-T family DNA segregation ATPase FtsK/SpoIIIE
MTTRCCKSIEADVHIDELLIAAIKVVVRSQSTSAAQLQRQCYVGYAAASRLLDRMERLGIVSVQSGSTPREVLVAVDALPRVVAGLGAS